MQDIIARAKAIMVTPQAEWPAIAQEPPDLAALFARYVAILALIPPLAGFLGGSLIGGYMPLVSGLIVALIGYALTFAVVYLVALLVDLLAPNFGGVRHFASAVRLTAYSFTPAWIAGIFLLVPGASFLTLLGLYGFYLLWIGLPDLMRAPHQKSLPYAAIVVACALVLQVGAGIALSVAFAR
jgi:Yip1 domain